MIVVAVVLSLLLGAAIYAFATRDGITSRLLNAMARNDTQEVAAILNCHGPSLPAARRDVAWDWIKLRAQDLARERLEYCMSRVDENGVRALLMVRGNLLTEAQCADAEAWLAEPYNDETDAQEDE